MRGTLFRIYWPLLCALALLPLLAQPGLAERGITVSSNPSINSQRRIALIIGNGAYQAGRLKNPVNDARDLANVLRGLGFQVTQMENLRQSRMKRAIDDFGHELKAGGVGFFFYAGHGVQVQGRNYLIPIGAVIQGEADVEYECVDAGRVLAKMETANNLMNIMVLDACRNNPYASSFRSVQTGLASLNAPQGTIVAYSASPGQTAADGTGRNSPFTSALIKHIATPGVSAVASLQRVQVAVLEHTHGKQSPWLGLSPIKGQFFFKPGKAPKRPMQLAGSPGPKQGEVDQRKLKIQNLLKQAGVDLRANRLASPKGNNALEKYRQVLALDPMNAQANEGLKKIVGKYVSLAEGRIKAGDWKMAESFLGRAAQVSEADPHVLEVRDKLRAAKKQAVVVDHDLKKQGSLAKNPGQKQRPDESTQTAHADISAIEAEIKRLKVYFTEDHPDIKRLKQRLKNVRKRKAEKQARAEAARKERERQEAERRQAARVVERSSDGRYTKNAQGVITDTQTGLQWFVGPDKAINWHSAKRWVESLSVAGGGWRMPTSDELSGLYEKDKGTRDIDPIFHTTGFFAWSSETKGTEKVYSFNYTTGSKYLTYPTVVDSNHRAFAVRSKQ